MTETAPRSLGRDIRFVISPWRDALLGVPTLVRCAAAGQAVAYRRRMRRCEQNPVGDFETAVRRVSPACLSAATTTIFATLAIP